MGYFAKGRWQVEKAAEKAKFTEQLQKLVELGKSKKSTLDMNDINDAFTGVELSVEQIEDIITYLESKGIDVLRVMNDELAIDDDMVLSTDEDGFSPEEEDEEDIDLDAIDLLDGVGTEDPVRMYLKEIGTVPLLDGGRRIGAGEEKGRGRSGRKRAADRGKPPSCGQYCEALYRPWNELSGSGSGGQSGPDQGR